MYFFPQYLEVVLKMVERGVDRLVMMCTVYLLGICRIYYFTSNSVSLTTCLYSLLCKKRMNRFRTLNAQSRISYFLNNTYLPTYLPTYFNWLILLKTMNTIISYIFPLLTISTNITSPCFSGLCGTNHLRKSPENWCFLCNYSSS